MKRLLPVVALLAFLPLVHPNGAEAPPEPAVGSADAGKTEIRYRDVYIPYDRLWRVFEEGNRGVFLPYDEYLKLREAADAAQGKDPGRVKPPVDNLISEVSGEITVRAEVAEIRASARLELLKEGWNEVRLGLDDVALTKAEIDGKAATILFEPETGYKLLVEKKGPEPESRALELAFAKACLKEPGRNSVSFRPPPAPVSRWEIRIPEPGVKVEVEPALASAEAEATEPDANETVVRAFVGAAPRISVAWTPKAEGAKGMQALVNVESEHEFRVEDGVTRSAIRLAFAITRAEVGTLRVAVPADRKVVNVFDENVREWSVAEEDGEQVVTVGLFKSIRGMQNLSVELEQFTGADVVSVPAVRVPGASRQHGTIVVAVAPGLRAEDASRSGLTRVDPAELPPGLANREWDFSYRYATVPFALDLRLEKITPEIVVQSLTEARLQPEELTLEYLAVADIRRAGIFSFDVTIPSDMEVETVAGTDRGGGAPANVDTYHVADDAATGRRALRVSLARKATGKTGILVRLKRTLGEPALLTPRPAPVTIPVESPRAVGAGISREAGTLVVHAAESLRVNAAGDEALRPIAAAEALRTLPGGRTNPGERVVLSYAFSDLNARVDLNVFRRPPHVTVRQVLRASVEPGTVKFDATLYTDVLYSGVKALRLDVPADIAERIRITTAGIRYAAVAPAPADAEEGYVAWNLEPETEFLGSREIRLTWDVRSEVLEVGSTTRIPIPRLIPRGADRTWGQIVLSKTEAVDVRPAAAEGLRPIDPRRDMIPEFGPLDAARAFEFRDAWSLSVEAARYRTEDVKATSIERALVRAVVTRGEVTGVQALYRMRSVRQRLAIELPDEVEFDARPLRIDGRPVPLERGEGNHFYVPLVGVSQGDPFLLELRYTVRSNALKLRVPEFPDEPAVQQVCLSVHVPEELAYLGCRGPWNPDLVWALRGFTLKPRGRRGPEELLAWVTEGLQPGDDLRNFATDGTHLLFSTLRPPPGPKGAVRIYAANSRVAKAVPLLVVIGVGLALLRAPVRRKIAGAGACVTVVALASVFLPSAVRSACSNALPAAAVIVGVVWMLWVFLALKPRLKFVALAGDKPPPVPRPAGNATQPDADAQPPEPGQEGGKSDA